MREDVHDAILGAADAGNDRLSAGSISRHVTSSRRRVSDVRRIVTRFLENLPDDATVHELREAMDDDGDGDV